MRVCSFVAFKLDADVFISHTNWGNVGERRTGGGGRSRGGGVGGESLPISKISA